MPSRLLPSLPSPTMIAGFVISVVLAAVSVSKGLVDPDYWWHITAGKLIAESGVPSTDQFSFTWAGQPWTPHEWLSEFLMYHGLEALGPALLLALLGATAGASIVVVSEALRRLGIRTVALVLPAILGTVIFIPYVTARPQAISWLFLAMELWVLISLRPSRPAEALWLIPLFAVWANLHGLYVIGLGIGGVYLLFTLIGRTPMSSAWKWVLGAGVGSALASMLTPAGPAGLFYPLRYVDSSDWGLANIAEWQSPDFHNPAHLAFLGLIVAVFLARGRTTPGWLQALAIIGVAMGLLALRNAPISALLAMPMMALHLNELLARRRERVASSPALALGRRSIELGVAVTVGIASWWTLVPADPDTAVVAAAHETFPIEAVDALRRSDPNARVVVEYGWAGYLIHQLYEAGGRVFVDGRNDMYPESLLEDYSAVRAADPGWEEIVDRHGANWLLFPPETTVTRGPAEDAGWCEAYRDDLQVLLERCR